MSAPERVSIDVAALKARLDIVAVISSYIPLQKRGAEMVGLCPFHGDRNPSLFVSPSKQIWTCFSRGCHEWEGGNDVIGFVRKYEDLPFRQACEKLGGTSAWVPQTTGATYLVQQKPERITSKPPAGVAHPDMALRQLGSPEHIRQFLDADGQLLGFECRYPRNAYGESPSRMWTWGARTGETPGWACAHFMRPRPLYGLDQLAKRPEARVLVSEGPKKKDSAEKLLGKTYVCVAWSGGAGSWHLHEWEPLRGRNVLLWPDADRKTANASQAQKLSIKEGDLLPYNEQPGPKAMLGLAAFLSDPSGLACKVRILSVMDVERDGYDIADMEADGMDSDAVIAWAKPRASDYSAPVAAEKTPVQQTDEPPLPPVEAYLADPPSKKNAEAVSDAAGEKPMHGATEWPRSIDLEALSHNDPQPPKFIIEDWLPVGYATLLAGHGGVGKSGIALELGICIAAGIPFCGIEVSRRRVLYLSCEDRESVLHWRLSRICAHHSINLGDLSGWLNVVDLVGHDVVLWERDPRTGNTVTPALGKLDQRIKDSGTELLVVDGISDTFAGNENARTEVKRYVNALVSMIPEQSGAVLLVGHISKPSATNGVTSEGYSGSTGWHNSVRARWYLYPETEPSDEGDRPARTGQLLLQLQKSNLGRTDQEMGFKWDEVRKLFVGQQTKVSTFDRRHQEREERSGLLRAFRGCSEAGIDVPAAMQGPGTAYLALSLRPEFPDSLKGSGGAKKRRFRRHVEELRQSRAIEEVEYRRTNRHRGTKLILTTEGMRQCA